MATRYAPISRTDTEPQRNAFCSLPVAHLPCPVNNTFTRIATFGHAQQLNRRNTNDEVLGDGGIGLEYRFTSHMGLFSDVRYNLVNESKNNFLSTRFGFRYAF